VVAIIKHLNLLHELLNIAKADEKRPLRNMPTINLNERFLEIIINKHLKKTGSIIITSLD
jgi:hypothetical protein